MPWKSSRQERILLWSASGVGKTYTELGIMKFAALTRTDNHFWIIDNDNQMEASGLVEGGTFEDLLPRVTVWVPESFDEYDDITNTIKSNASPEDWVFIDMLSNVYQSLPDWWVANVYGENPHTYWSSVRREIVEAQQASRDAGEKARGHEKQFGGTSGVDWQYIGKQYRAWEKRLSIFAPCHVLALCGEQEIEERYDASGAKRAQYANTNGIAPKGEKDAVHRFHTTMRMQQKVGRDGRTVSARSITMHKDRDRTAKWEELGGRGRTIELTEGPRFAWDYLVKVGAWRPSGG